MQTCCTIRKGYVLFSAVKHAYVHGSTSENVKEYSAYIISCVSINIFCIAPLLKLCEH